MMPGSPPRARGKVFALHLHRLATGITPACAGKREIKYTKETRPGDHPRVRGEKQAALAENQALKGSPPRARGKVAD